MLASILPYRSSHGLLPLFQPFLQRFPGTPDARLLVFLLLVIAENMICWLRTHVFCKVGLSDLSLPVIWDV